MEFPAGSTILIPSAAVTHSNISVGADERRYSFTQFTAGAIFRYVDNGHQGVTAHAAELDEEERALRDEELSRQLEMGLSLFCNISELERTRGVKMAAEDEDGGNVATV